MTTAVKQLSDLNIAGKRVLIRQDLNVPLSDGDSDGDSATSGKTITSSKRIEASLPTIEHARDAGAKVLLMSHLGRPLEGQAQADFSLQPVAQYLSSRLGQRVALNRDYLTAQPVLENGQIVLLENVRFNRGERANDRSLGKQYAELCDIFVMDAFGAVHRTEASTHGVGMAAKTACAGPLLCAELNALEQAFTQPAHPLVSIVGGAKVSTKLTVLESLLEKVDQLVPGGGIANTFIAAAGYGVGKSLFEADLVEQAKTIMARAKQRGAEIPLPVDVVVGQQFSADAEPQVKAVDDVAEQDLILDIGPQTAQQYAEIMKTAGTIIWNGPVGVFEFEQFSQGSRRLGKAIAESTAFSIAGGGDTLAAIEKFNLTEQISYISTGGGAFLEFIGGKTLPVVAMLQSRAYPELPN